MAEFNVLENVRSLLESNWISSNTDNKTPLFINIADFKRYDYNRKQDIVIVQRATEEDQPAGVGDTDKHEFSNFDMDVRVIGRDQEQHWLNNIGEIKRIFKANKKNPFNPTLTESHILEWDGSGPDLSDKTHNLWRRLIPSQLKRYNVTR